MEQFDLKVLVDTNAGTQAILKRIRLVSCCFCLYNKQFFDWEELTAPFYEAIENEIPAKTLTEVFGELLEAE